MLTHPNRKTSSAYRKAKQGEGMKNAKNNKVCGEKNKDGGGGCDDKSL